MSDEESFVILGSSPMSSLELDVVNGERKSSINSSSLETVTPGNSFRSLKHSQIKDLQNAQEISTQTPESIVDKNTFETQGSDPKSVSLIASIQNGINADKLNDSISQKQAEINKTSAKTPVKIVETTKTSDTSYADGKLWSHSPQIEKSVEEVLSGLSLEECAVHSILESKKQQANDLNKPQREAFSSSSKPASLERTVEPNNLKGVSSVAVTNSLASSFIMGEINADVLKVGKR